MTELNSTIYYTSREQHERQLADAAINPAVAEIHREMAARYSELIVQSSRGHSLSDVRRSTSARRRPPVTSSPHA